LNRKKKLNGKEVAGEEKVFLEGVRKRLQTATENGETTGKKNQHIWESKKGTSNMIY